MSTQFGEDYGLVHEAIVTGRKVGAGREFWAAIAHNEALFARVVAVVAEALRAVFTLVVNIERDITGWECLESVPAEEGEFEPTLREFLQEGESFADGELMVRRAKEQGALAGLRHAEAMLRNQERIPIGWRKYVLVFSEVWQSPDGIRNVWSLYWHGKRWYLCSYWLEYDFSSCYRLVSPRKYQNQALDA